MTFMKITRKRVILSCLVLSCLVLFSVWHGQHARFTHGKVALLAEKHFSRVLDKIQATDGQKEQIRHAAGQIKAEWTKTKGASRTDFQTIFDGLLQSDINDQHYHNILDNILDQYRTFSHKTLDQLIRMSRVLTPEQRTNLKHRYEEAHQQK